MKCETQMKSSGQKVPLALFYTRVKHIWIFVHPFLTWLIWLYRFIEARICRYLAHLHVSFSSINDEGFSKSPSTIQYAIQKSSGQNGRNTGSRILCCLECQYPWGGRETFNYSKIEWKQYVLTIIGSKLRRTGLHLHRNDLLRNYGEKNCKSSFGSRCGVQRS